MYSSFITQCKKQSMLKIKKTHFFLKKQHLLIHIRYLVMNVLSQNQLNYGLAAATSPDLAPSSFSLLFGSQLLCPVLSVAFEQLVDEAEFILFFHRIERREGVSFILQDGHLGSVQVLSVGEPCHPRVAAWLRLKPRCKDLEQLWNQILLLQRREVTVAQQIYSTGA